MDSWMPRRWEVLLTAALLLPVGPVAAQDGPIEMADDPFEIADPIAAAPGSAEAAFVGLYERARTGRIRGTAAAETELEFGLAPRLEVRLGQSGAYGNLETRRRLGSGLDLTDSEGSGAAAEADAGERANWGGTSQIGAMYQLTDDSGAMPAVGLLGRLRALYGPGRTGYEAEGVALIGKTLIGGARPLGAHLNLGWTARIDPQPGERSGRYLLNASIGQTITHDTALVVTYALSQQQRGDRDYSLVQAGFRHRLSATGTVIGVAAGIGLNRDSPRFQLALAVQWSINGGR
jgi:hypothetical protein